MPSFTYTVRDTHRSSVHQVDARDIGVAATKAAAVWGTLVSSVMPTTDPDRQRIADAAAFYSSRVSWSSRDAERHEYDRIAEDYGG